MPDAVRKRGRTFGISHKGRSALDKSSSCFRGAPFNLTCNAAYQPPKLFWGGIEVSNISLETAEMTIQAPMSFECDYFAVSMSRGHEIDLEIDWPFTFSQRNLFFTIGCDFTSTLRGYWGRDAVSSCTAQCSSDPGLMADDNCDGFGCCQIPISKGVRKYDIAVRRSSHENFKFNHSLCGFGFLAEKESFKFKKSYLRNYSFYSVRNKSFPVVLDWAINNTTCDVAQSSADYACKDVNAQCISSTLQPGYLCACKEGFEGNPYLQCTDVNECADNTKNNCTHFCHNDQGSYHCSCPRGMLGNGRRDGSGCKLPVAQLAVGINLIIITLVLVGTLMFCYLQKKRLEKLKVEYYYQNGGAIHNRLSSRGAVDILKVYREKEIKKATNNYSEVIGEGGYGVVYKGRLPQCGEVAVKKSKKLDENQVEDFINELSVLYRMNHKNVVKLLGCCLDVKSPILVYEFIDNGTLAHRLHHKDLAGTLSFENRLKIALESAGALAYLHSDVSVPIIHGDIKSANILLDSNLNAKVSDFGTSKLVPSDQRAQIETIVKGTPGYLDPEYLQTCQLTEKSDVYSFGAVLVELLTGRRPAPGGGPHRKSTLAHFIDEMSRNRLSDVVDPEYLQTCQLTEKSDVYSFGAVLVELLTGRRPAPGGGPHRKPTLAHFIDEMSRNRLSDVVEQRVWVEGGDRVVNSVGHLAERCLRVKGADRPTMKEVAAELQQLVKRSSDHPWGQETHEVKVSLLGLAWDDNMSTAAGEYTTAETHISHDIELGGR